MPETLANVQSSKYYVEESPGYTMKYLYHHRTMGMNVEGVHIRSICCALEGKGHRVRLVSVDSTNDNFHQVKVLKKQGNGKAGLLKMVARRVPEPLFEMLEVFYNFFSIFRLWKVVHQYRPDYIYERYSLFLFSTLILAKIYRIPVVYEINDSAVLDRLRPLFFKGIAKFIEGEIFRAAHGLVFVSTRLREIIIKSHPQVALNIVSPNAIDPAVFYYDSEKKSQAKEKLQLNGKVVCGFIGCFARWHGVHIFMEKLAPLIKSHPDLFFLLIGDGDTLVAVRKIIAEYRVEDQVITTGNIPHDQVIEYIRAMDFSVLPSSNEYGSPMKQFELMGAGVPLVAPDFPPVTEIIDDNENGWIFKRQDFDHCISRVLEIYDKPNELGEKGQAAAHKIHQKHQWKHNIEQLDELFKLSTLRNSQT